MSGTLCLRFAGPFSWPGLSDAPTVFDAYEAQHRGIYVRTVPRPDGHMIYDADHAGESLGRRLLDEYRWHAAGMSRLHAPDAFAHGEKVLLWPGCRDSSAPRPVSHCVSEFPRLAHAIHGLTHVYRFLLAPFDGSARLRERALAAIVAALHDHGGQPRAFQEIAAAPLPRQQRESPLDCRISSTVPLLGLPELLSI